MPKNYTERLQKWFIIDTSRCYYTKIDGKENNEDNIFYPAKYKGDGTINEGVVGRVYLVRKLKDENGIETLEAPNLPFKTQEGSLKVNIPANFPKPKLIDYSPRDQKWFTVYHKPKLYLDDANVLHVATYNGQDADGSKDGIPEGEKRKSYLIKIVNLKIYAPNPPFDVDEGV